MFDAIAAAARGGWTVLLFAFFGLGALLLSPLMIFLRTPDRCQPPIRAAWRLLIWVCRATGLISVDSAGLGKIEGCIIAANHPSLIDVVLVTALVPRTLFVAKHALKGNPFISAIVRHTALPDDHRLIDVARPYLANGWNILVFPEGTRSPQPGEIGPLHRGTAQLALRIGAPLVCVGIRPARRILGKRQPPWDMGCRRVAYVLRSGIPRCIPCNPRMPLRRQAEAATGDIRSALERLAQEA